MSELFKKEQSTDIKDRKLGDEWENWDGADGGTISSGKGLFLGFAALTTAILNIIMVVSVYMTSPRLAQWSEMLPFSTAMITAAVIIISIIFVVQLTVTALTEKNLFISKKQAYMAFNLLFANIFRVSKVFGISRDKMGHSFVLVSNAVSRATAKETSGRVMILLPRCLTKDQLTQINALKDSYPVDVFTVSGGELARKKVKELRPCAIIGVACERDLVSGIRDVGDKIPVIGIPNMRPEGPCKDTTIDMEKLYEAVRFYCDKIHDGTSDFGGACNRL